MAKPLVAPVCFPQFERTPLGKGTPTTIARRLDPPAYDRGLKSSVEKEVYPIASESTSTCAETPGTTPSPPASVSAHYSQDLHHYIPVGCLRYNTTINSDAKCSRPATSWFELLFASLPEEIKAIIDSEALRLLEAGWIRLFLLNAPNAPVAESIFRLYLLPEDWGRKLVDRRSKSLKQALRNVLARVDVSPETWDGRPTEKHEYFDPWATAENVSLFYLFNKLPSPSPNPDLVKNRYSRNAVLGLIEAGNADYGEQAIPGLKTKLYPYQARSAALMVQRESAPQLQLDPRLEVRRTPTGADYFFSARDGSFLREPRYYEANRGGILAETMGLGKTVICLAVILATKGHLPKIPPAYQKPPPIRKNVASLVDMVAHTIGRNAIPGRAYLENLEADAGLNLENCKRAIVRHVPYYEIPAEVPRFNRNTVIPPPRQLIMCASTIVVVPKNLLHQWQSEIRKHVAKGALKVLVMDTEPRRGSKSKSSKTKMEITEDIMDLRSEIPAPTELMAYDIVLFTKSRFEQDIQDGADEKGRRIPAGAPLSCNCPYIGATRTPDCTCLTKVYESPLKRVHWLRIIIDEGHSLSSGMSNAARVARQLKAERRWVVSGTPAKNLVGVELELLSEEQADGDPMLLRELAIEQRKRFSLDDEDNTQAAKALGSLAANFLLVKPWSESSTEGKLEWDDYVYRHEHHRKKTWSGFSTCFLRVLEGLVVKTRPEDVDRDIQLPPMRHKTVYLKPCWFDKMTANLFIQVLRANAVTSERTDVDYLFHKNSVSARHSLIRNLRQSNFTWTGFGLEDVISTLETSQKYLDKQDRRCPVEDANSLEESCRIVSALLDSEVWQALSRAHEIGLAVENWPQESEKGFALASTKPTMIGPTQLLEGQSHVDRQILLDDPAAGLDVVGRVAKAKLIEREEVEMYHRACEMKDSKDLQKAAVPSSALGGQPLTSRRTSILQSQSATKRRISSTPQASPVKSNRKPSLQPPSDRESQASKLRSGNVGPSPAKSDSLPPTQSAQDESVEEITASPASRPRKRKITAAEERGELPANSPLRNTRIIGTSSAKLTYLIDKVVKHQASEKILIFYDGENAAFYIAQCLEMLYINHRIYARTLANATRSEYVALFNEDPDVRVLLIDVACGALGLNLNAASVVLIVNPINRPGLEAQAIKRAHRIGQTRDVLVETLVLEGTIEEAIFKRAKQMSRAQHLEAKTLEDDNQIVSIIQNAAVLPILPGEDRGIEQFARLQVPQRVFGRPGRERYHRFGEVDGEEKEKNGRKRVRLPKKAKGKEDGDGDGVGEGTANKVQVQVQAVTTPTPSNSIFGPGGAA